MIYQIRWLSLGLVNLAIGVNRPHIFRYPVSTERTVHARQNTRPEQGRRFVPQDRTQRIAG